VNPLNLKVEKINNNLFLIVQQPVKAQKGAGMTRSQTMLNALGHAIPQNADFTVTGKVTDNTGTGLPGVSVLISGTTSGTATNFDGTFSLSVPDQKATLIFSFIGFAPQTVPVNGQANLLIKLLPDAKALEEVVVTGYTTQRKKDIIGAVTVIKSSELTTTPSANLTSQLQGRAAGVTVSSTGDPGGTANVRIRGFSSYGNNNPLYVIDGVPTTDPSRINPQDIESLQVLKDASAASIYGARAANGVIIITTKQGKAGKTEVSYDTYVGFQRIPYNRIPEVLNTAETMQYLDRTTAGNYVDPVFGPHGSFAIPDKYIVSKNFKGGVSANDPRADPSLYTISDYKNTYQIFNTSPGTDWFRAMSQQGLIQSHQLTASGGTEASTYSMGLNYFDQEGTFKYTGYDRYTVRANSSFQPTKFFRFGENLQIAVDNRKGDNIVIGETSAWANAYRSAPYVPVYDINGGYGGSLIGSTSGIGWNPVAQLSRRKDWTNKSLRIFGNVFGEAILSKYLTARTSLGVESGNGMLRQGLLREYERSEARSVTSLTEGSYAFSSWTWSNTLTFQKTLGTDHEVKVLLGTEAIKNNSRNLSASVSNFDLEADEFLSLNTGLPRSLSDLSASNPNIATTALFSYFGRVDYGYKGKYLFNATFRRDGSSLFGASVRYGNFPSGGLAWRVSDENFMQQYSWLNDLKIRAGWGIMGSISNVPAFNQYSTFSSTAGRNFYDISGGNIGSTQGYGVSAQGNLLTKWESTETTNIGLDMAFLQNSWSISLDVYNKNTRDLLVPSLRNGLEPLITKPLVNLGTMNNKGLDLQINNQGTVTGDLKYDVGLSFTHYKNRLTKLNDENTAQLVAANRMADVLITTKGQAISSFYGYQIDGFYNTQQDIDQGPRISGSPGQVGTWKYKDLDGDGNITPADRTVLGSPHPDFQMGLNVGLRWKNFDFNTFLFWSQGSEIFNYNKYYTYMNVLGGGIAKGKLNDAWTPETAASAKTPALGVGPANGYTSFVTGNPTSFYIENGSFLRAKTLQVGYTIPAGITRKASISKLRVYAQVQNLFTITKYTGADPDLGLVSGSSSDQSVRSDQNLGVDYSGFPTPKQLLVGLNLSF
jgi:TonB-linked SusC/RagA family outer membrane protein